MKHHLRDVENEVVSKFKDGIKNNHNKTYIKINKEE